VIPREAKVEKLVFSSIQQAEGRTVQISTKS